MKIMLLIAFRNLFRQKSRSTLIGIGICLSVAFIVIGNSLNKGMYGNIINNIVDSNLSGHCRINGFEKNGSVNMAVIRDKEKIVSRLEDAFPNIKRTEETLSVTVYTTVNGKGAYLLLANMTAASVDEILNMKVVDGDISRFVDGSVANPLVLEYKKAAALKVKPGDVLKARLTTIYGQVQTAQLELVATVKLTNSFMATFMHGAMPTERLKEIAGYRKNETQSLNIVFRDLAESGDMVLMADRIHRKLESELTSIQTEFEGGNPLSESISRSWRLADRTYSQRDYEMKQRAIRRSEYVGNTIDVMAMQELADEVFKMESSQGAMLLVVMLLVLTIVIVGIINTTKMNMRERTREIGTVRAIGMTKSAVVVTLVMEMALLTAIASAAGILVAYGLMELLSGIQFQSDDFNLAAILNNGHLSFKVPLNVIAANVFIIFLVNLFAVYSPARKAAGMVVAKALGHHE